MVYSFDDIDEALYSNPVDHSQKALIETIWLQAKSFGLQDTLERLVGTKGGNLEPERLERQIDELVNDKNQEEAFWLLISLSAAAKMVGKNVDDASESAFYIFECLENRGAQRDELYRSFMGIMRSNSET